MKKWVTVALVVTFIVVAVLIVKNRRNKKDESPVLECPDFTPKYLGEDAVSSDGYDIEKAVVLGDYGPEVAYVQQRLNSQYGADVTVDGKFGCETWFALQAFTGLDGSESLDLNDLK